jgi:hypothetical protein
MSIEIHEFSTGIRVEKTANGGWVSLGFTGQYMNCTLERIPEAVERSIANREFAVTEGASTEQPAIIGRVVGTGEDAWSVMAVVTRGRDEKGRSVSVYRYFLCKGENSQTPEANNLWKILDWFESQKRPKFDPFETKIIGKPNLHTHTVVSRNYQKQQQVTDRLALDTSQPILLQQHYDDYVWNVHLLAIDKSRKNKQPISWAFNVEALEQPHRFQVIQPASDRAYQILQRAIAHVPQVSVPIVVDEEALKSALRSLMNSSQVKPDAIQVIAEALGNEQITSEYWHSLFDGQGAATAIKQKIYTSQMVRLVTLRAMVIPETLPEFLTWLNVKGSKNTPDENQTISLEFQAAIRNVFPKDKLLAGLKLIILKLVKENDITPEVIYWLIKKKGSAWFAVYDDFIAQILSDLQLIYKNIKANKKANIDKKPFNFEPIIWQELISYYNSVTYSNYYPHKFDYKPLAELFSYLERYKISAYFYQVSHGAVPKNIFIKAFPNYTGGYYEFDELGLTLEKELSFVEEIIYFLLQEFIVPIQIVIPLSFIIFMSGIFIGNKIFTKQSSNEQTTDVNKLEREDSKDNNLAVQVTGQGSKSFDQTNTITMPGQIRKKATTKQNLEKTIAAIDSIANEISKKDINPNITDINEVIKKIKQNNNFDYPKFKENIINGQDSHEKDRFVESIYKYQKHLKQNLPKLEVNGYIEINDETYNFLIKEIKK